MLVVKVLLFLSLLPSPEEPFHLSSASALLTDPACALGYSDSAPYKIHDVLHYIFHNV